MYVYTQVHGTPNIFTVRHFLTDSEIEYLLQLTADSKKRGKFRGSKTDDDAGTGLNDTKYRTSKTMHLKKGMDATIRRIEARAAGASTALVFRSPLLAFARYAKTAASAEFSFFSTRFSRCLSVCVYLSVCLSGCA